MLFLLCACRNEEDNYISEHTKEVMQNKEIAIYGAEDRATNEENMPADVDITSQDILESKQTKIDYYKHGGVVDCIEIDDCMSKANIIKEKFSDLISGVFYLEVINDDGNILGYFNDYSFKEHSYPDIEACNENGNLLKKIIKPHDIDFLCSDDAVLQVVLAK